MKAALRNAFLRVVLTAFLSDFDDKQAHSHSHNDAASATGGLTAASTPNNAPVGYRGRHFANQCGPLSRPPRRLISGWASGFPMQAPKPGMPAKQSDDIRVDVLKGKDYANYRMKFQGPVTNKPGHKQVSQEDNRVSEKVGGHEGRCELESGAKLRRTPTKRMIREAFVEHGTEHWVANSDSDGTVATYGEAIDLFKQLRRPT